MLSRNEIYCNESFDMHNIIYLLLDECGFTRGDFFSMNSKALNSQMSVLCVNVH